MHKEFGSQVDQTLFKGIGAAGQSQKQGTYMSTGPANVAKINQVCKSQQSHIHMPQAWAGNSAQSARYAAPYMSMTQKTMVNKPSSFAMPTMMTPAPVAQFVSRTSTLQMSMGSFKPNFQTNQSQSLYGAAMASRVPKVRASVSKRVGDVKMSAAQPNFNIHSRWGSIAF